MLYNRVFIYRLSLLVQETNSLYNLQKPEIVINRLHLSTYLCTVQLTNIENKQFEMPPHS